MPIKIAVAKSHWGDIKFLNNLYAPNDVYDVLPDNSMTTAKSSLAQAINKKSGPGGIDFKSDKIDNAFVVQNSGGVIKFNIDPAMLQQLQHAPGFVPMIINIQPLKDLSSFLGLKNQEQKDFATL